MKQMLVGMAVVMGIGALVFGTDRTLAYVQAGRDHAKSRVTAFSSSEMNDRVGEKLLEREAARLGADMANAAALEDQGRDLGQRIDAANRARAALLEGLKTARSLLAADSNNPTIRLPSGQEVARETLENDAKQRIQQLESLGRQVTALMHARTSAEAAAKRLRATIAEAQASLIEVRSEREAVLVETRAAELAAAQSRIGAISGGGAGEVRNHVQELKLKLALARGKLDVQAVAVGGAVLDLSSPKSALAGIDAGLARHSDLP